MRCLSLILLFACSLEILAADHLWARATPPGSTSGAVYGVIANDTEAARRLESVTLAGARHVMLHETVLVDGVLRMRHADVELAPGASVELAPGGLHIMVMGLNDPFVEGCRETVTLHWADGETRDVPVDVGSYGQQEPPAEPGEPCP